MIPTRNEFLAQCTYVIRLRSRKVNHPLYMAFYIFILLCCIVQKTWPMSRTRQFAKCSAFFILNQVFSPKLLFRWLSGAFFRRILTCAVYKALLNTQNSCALRSIPSVSFRWQKISWCLLVTGWRFLSNLFCYLCPGNFYLREKHELRNWVKLHNEEFVVCIRFSWCCWCS
jgi:hypothetical protein